MRQRGSSRYPRSGPMKVAPSRWSGAGLGTDIRDGGMPPREAASSAVTLSSNMRVQDVIRQLLSSNAVCFGSEQNDGVFYVRVNSTMDGSEMKAADGEDLFCIGLQDLLEAPPQLPLECLIDPLGEGAEECDLYETRVESYLDKSPQTELLGRLPWLVGLLAFLTVSSAIMEYYDALVQRHLIVAFYLTALVGCGGNSGSQASALVLQALATGELAPTVENILMVARKELVIAVGVAAVLSAGVLGRIVLFGGSLADGLSIALAMSVTVVFSVVFGAVSPMVLQRSGIDPAKVSGPLLSTVIDIAGVLLACLAAAALEAFGIF